MRIAYLCCDETLPGRAEPRGHAFEHDLSVGLLRTAMVADGGTVDEISWRDADADFAAFDAALIGTTWDYWDHHADFLSALDRIASATRLFNPPETVRWNSHKRYLDACERAGVPTIPTLWLDAVTPEAIARAFETWDTELLVAKRQVGAGARDQHRLRRGDAVPAMTHPMMVQPYVPAIASEGEFSFLFIDGTLSHALVKRPQAGDYRVQRRYGGREMAITPSAADMAAAEAALAVAGPMPLYARVDMVRGDDGGLLLMELELIEPYFYPVQGPRVFEYLAAALRRQVG